MRSIRQFLVIAALSTGLGCVSSASREPSQTRTAADALSEGDNPAPHQNAASPTKAEDSSQVDRTDSKEAVAPAAEPADASVSPAPARDGPQTERPFSPADSAGAAPDPGPGGGALPAPWKSRDIGMVKAKGTVQYANGVFAFNNSGKEFWHGDDLYHFAYQPLKGDGEIVARLVSVTAADHYENIGVLFSFDPEFTWYGASKKLAPGAKMFFTPAQGAVWGERVRSEGQGNWWGPGPDVVADGIKLPFWVKVVRKGTRFTGFYSADGQAWKMAKNNAGRGSEVSIAEVPETMWVGVFSCPHQDKLADAKIDNVKVTPAP